MNPGTFQGPVSGHHLVAGTHVSGGTLNINYHGFTPPTPIKPFSMIPFDPDPVFVKRPAISQRIRELTAGAGRRAALVGDSRLGLSLGLGGALSEALDCGLNLGSFRRADDNLDLVGVRILFVKSFVRAKI